MKKLQKITKKGKSKEITVSNRTQLFWNCYRQDVHLK